MFSSVQHPLGYAQQLCSIYTHLSQAADDAMLLNDFVHSASRLSGCELSQLFMFDVTPGCLKLKAQVLDGNIRSGSPDNDVTDHSAEHLFQFVVRNGKPVSISDLSCALYNTCFLPGSESAWRSLVCVPLMNRDQTVAGLLVCASREVMSLEVFAASLGSLGTFVVSQQALLRRHQPLASASMTEPQSAVSSYGLISNSAAMRQTCELVGKVLQSPYTVLLTGETGTGKEVVARAIHDHGPRRSKAFVVQNCAAFPESLLESELFGYRKGAFTGADRDHRGLFDVAHEGTLLLDEIGDMPIGLQAKLLRVLQEGEIRPLGSNTVRKVNVRIIAATHRDLPALIAQGRFREDLYYRLAQFPVALPALRQRGEDIEPLARLFADNACEALKRARVAWSQAALASLSTHPFPGNIRQLKGFVERAVLLSENGELLPEHFPFAPAPQGCVVGVTFRERMEQFERGLLLDYLHKSNGNRTVTARTLGLSRRTLLYRLAHLDINSAQKGRC
ncbi:sigma-54-dependent Fis family transcriptional regulator [Pseudomonas asturiensis]|uniref:Sigma-54-dependent Fis family transcriptional regulator n=1 Tax=Pseudomonas asturiensis TaxID=1190415 RepID=A0ABX6HDL4_9PSED|nr:sigma-54-dependent Fis family transcriptional regulator [Pseudomonas asturiensis]QHF03687.1 sigma-54-dependent Fis family transcriptional regulator [Pseudomonas asturiensis]